ncbi:unnamed protein product [Rhizoctonia solani]|uniref:PWI domain-containing protein n=1 Tax=Rhizoctonia solani TaxID=456999 RepID=A0A8H3BXH4_9AGAM|nr:unnamed protein product [Rhizoctonia solani]
MADAGFFKGTSAEQDRRFADKEHRLLKSMKFPPEFDRKVDMRKVNLQVMRPWITKKVVELVGFEDEVVVEYAMGLLEEQSKPPDPKLMQINLTGFLESKTPAFMSALWTLLLEAQDSPAGVPASFVQEKKEELRQKHEADERVLAEARRRGDHDLRSANASAARDVDVVEDVAGEIHSVEIRSVVELVIRDGGIVVGEVDVEVEETEVPRAVVLLLGVEAGLRPRVDDTDGRLLGLLPLADAVDLPRQDVVGLPRVGDALHPLVEQGVLRLFAGLDVPHPPVDLGALHLLVGPGALRDVLLTAAAHHHVLLPPDRGADLPQREGIRHLGDSRRRADSPKRRADSPKRRDSSPPRDRTSSRSPSPTTRKRRRSDVGVDVQPLSIKGAASGKKSRWGEEEKEDEKAVNERAENELRENLLRQKVVRSLKGRKGSEGTD